MITFVETIVILGKLPIYQLSTLEETNLNSHGVKFRLEFVNDPSNPEGNTSVLISIWTDQAALDAALADPVFVGMIANRQAYHDANGISMTTQRIDS